MINQYAVDEIKKQIKEFKEKPVGQISLEDANRLVDIIGSLIGEIVELQRHNRNFSTNYDDRYVEKIPVGKTIKHFRTITNITLPELAKKASVSKGYLSQIENGKNCNPD